MRAKWRAPSTSSVRSLFRPIHHTEPVGAHPCRTWTIGAGSTVCSRAGGSPGFQSQTHVALLDPGFPPAREHMLTRYDGRSAMEIVTATAAKQPKASCGTLDCFATLAMTAKGRVPSTSSVRSLFRPIHHTEPVGAHPVEHGRSAPDQPCAPAQAGAQGSRIKRTWLCVILGSRLRGNTCSDGHAV